MDHQTFRIGIDLMGGDTSPVLLLESVLALAQELDGKVDLFVFGTQSVINSSLNLSKNVKGISVSEVITNEDDPLVAVRRKRDSSLCAGMRMLQKHELDAFVSAGNTGALIACAKLCLSMLPNIVRPALLALLPTKLNEVAVLDIGATVKSKVEHLVQFASMGVAYQKTRGIHHPKVGLLNIGSEKTKGTPELREAYEKLQFLNRNCNKNAPIFIGNIEGRDVFQGNIDVLVTDGFTGNVFLKTAEGIATFILDQLGETADEECSPHLKNTLSALRKRLHYAEYPGAILCGVDGVVVKCHGDSTPRSLINGINGALRLLEHDFLEKIKNQLTMDAQKFSFVDRLKKIRGPKH